MAPPRHHHAQQHHHHAQGAGGHGGSPFPPLSLQASGVASSSSPNAAGSNGHAMTGAAAAAASASGGTNHTYHHDPGSSGLPPAPSKIDTMQAQTYRLQDAYWSDDDEDMDCPLCLEEIDISDANFKPCPCGYQICRFCWHHIKSNLNGRCPACRRKYSDTTVEFKAMSQDEIKKLSQAKKQKEREKRELEQMNRKHLANMRVVQKNLVYVVGMDPKLAREELIPTLRSQEYFGQYGRISKILISKRTTASKLIMGTQESAIGVYVTYVRKEDAARAIIAIDGSKSPDGRTIRASYGTTKYCTTYLRNLPCTNPICTYLHEPGEEADSFTKEDLTTLRHAAKDSESRHRPTPAPGSFGHTSNAAPAAAHTSQQQLQATPVGLATANLPTSNDPNEPSALPKTVSWATQKMATPGNGAAAVGASGGAASAIQDQDLPPLSALANAQSQKKQQQQQQQSRPIAQSPATAKVITPSQKAKARPSTPTLMRTDSPVPPSSKEGGSPAPPAPPGLNRRPSQVGVVNVANAAQTKSAPREGTTSAVPPGLSKIGMPPGLSRPATPVQDSPRVQSAALNGYQPSSNAQAVLDDMRSRRTAAASHPAKSPFPDFDQTLSSFADGDDFSFNFEEGLVPAHLRSTNTHTTASFGRFAPFAFGNSFSRDSTASAGASTNQNQSAISSRPGLGTSDSSYATDPPTYSGRFDPFAPGAGESLLQDESKEAASSPFATIDQMRRTLSEDRGVSDAGQGEKHEAGEEEASASRFGFAKQQPRDSFKTSDDLLGFIKRGANVNGMANDFGAGRPFHGEANGHFPSMDGFARDNHPIGDAGAAWRSNAHQESPLAGILPLHHVSSPQSAGNSYTTDPSYFGNASLASFGRGPISPMDAPTNRQESPLLAQLMNRRLNAGVNNNGMMSMQDASLASSNQRHAQNQQSSPSPFGSHYGDQSAPSSAFASGNGNQAHSASLNSLLSQFAGGNRQ